MKVVTAAEMRRIDQNTIEDIGIPGIVLMETAGSEIVKRIVDYYPNAHRIGIFVGKGNNGGDGLVIARQLAHSGRDVSIFLLSPQDSFTEEAYLNLEISEKLGLHIEEILTDTSFTDILGFDNIKGKAESSKIPHRNIANFDLFVDAILGTGLRGDVRPRISNVINAINDQSIPILAVDLPSGLDADTGNPLGTCIQADRTVTIGLPKRGLLVHPGAELSGELDVVDIGFPRQVIDAQNINVNWITEDEAVEWIPQRKPSSYKGSYGRVLVVAGSTGMTGAAALASEAALRIGAGLVTLAIPESLNPILEEKLSEVMTLPLPETDNGSFTASSVSPVLEYAIKNKSVLAIGPGLSQHPETVTFVHQLIQENYRQELDLRIVIDADGLNALAQEKDLLQLINEKVVLTPHPGEMSRLIDIPVTEFEVDRIGISEEFAKENGVTLVLKGAPTITSDSNGNTWINSTGNAGMATAGMGDVLTGVIAGLIAQNVPIAKAATLGVYLHGLAGDIVAEQKGMHGLIATDVLNALPQTISSLVSN
ncbi:NAD(P)H-hydrate dehydratase [Candidatus Poribacteria bacterium]|nr:NAD(P)H-hydrate dehydratase [Candidatus Poribacteria bacterium]